MRADVAENNGNGALATKELNDEAMRRTVQTIPPGQSAFSHDQGLFFFVSNASEEIEAWGRNVKLRDSQLRQFITVEPMFASALATVASRNASFNYTIEGSPEQTKAVQDILQTANFGRGWADFILKLSVDLYTQDSGAFIEIIRERDAFDAPVVGIANIDAARCFHTGHPDVPVVYLDRNNKYHYLKWYQVCHISEMPATYEGIPGMQYCALTRLLREVRIARDTGIYIQEKIGGRNTRAVTLVKGVTADQVAQSIEKAGLQNDARGLLRYSQPIIISPTSPEVDIGFETLELASLPDGFDPEVRNKWYVAIIAMAFLSDYQEFAPLPGGGLGTGAQSETQAKKSRGKGSALFQKLVEQAFNWTIFPKEIEFRFAEQDLDEEQADALARKTRAEERAARITSGELSPEVARMRAYSSGDLTDEELAELEKQAEEMKRERELQAQAAIAAVQPNQDQQVEGDESETSGDNRIDDTAEKTEEKATGDRAGPETARLRVEEQVEQIINSAFEDLYASLLDRGRINDTASD